MLMANNGVLARDW